MARTKKELESENRELRDLLGDVYDRVAGYLDADNDLDDEDDDEDEDEEEESDDQ